MRELIALALRRIPMEVIEAEDGQAALTAMAERVPNLVITDLNMPVMDGWTLLRRMREDARLRDVLIVVITTEQGTLDRARAIALGASSYLTKPIRAPRLLSEVKSLLKLP